MAATSFLKRVTGIALLSLGIAQAHASVFDINLTGTVSEGTFSSFTSDNIHYDQWSLWLTGFDSVNPISVSVGDTINATVTLDQSFTIPAPPDAYFSGVDLNIGGSAFPPIDTATFVVEAAFFNNSVPGLTGGNDCSTNGRLAGCALFFDADMSKLTFDKMTMSFMIGKLGVPPGQQVSLDNARLGYSVFSPAVPEPETYAMMMAGLGMVGFMVRRRKAQA